MYPYWKYVTQFSFVTRISISLLILFLLFLSFSIYCLSNLFIIYVSLCTIYIYSIILDIYVYSFPLPVFFSASLYLKISLSLYPAFFHSLCISIWSLKPIRPPPPPSPGNEKYIHFPELTANFQYFPSLPNLAPSPIT